MPNGIFPPPGRPSDSPIPIPDDVEFTAYRIVKAGAPSDAGYENSFKSHAELQIPPRGRELEHPQIYEGISVYDTQEQAAEVARRWPKIGGFVAEISFSGADIEVRALRWGSPGHLTLWGDPLMLSRTTTEVTSV